MKLLFLIFHGFEESNGISKKIRYQVKALEECGVDVHLCWLDDSSEGHKRRMINENTLKDYGYGVKAKILKRTSLGCIAKYVDKNDIPYVYIRSDHNTTPFLIHLLARFKSAGKKVVMEIPTYPYDHEYKGLSLGYQKIIYMDKCLRNIMARYIDKFVTFSDHKEIFGRPTIRIANGVDFTAIPLKEMSEENQIINLIAVATIHPWHGFDRAISGMINYKEKQKDKRVVLHIVGEGVPEVVDKYKKLAKDNDLGNDVIFHGPLFGDALNDVFNISHMGIGSLARHRSGITHLRSLKNREYAARGIPFVYSEIDEDFENQTYVMKALADETPLNIEQVVDFYKGLNISPQNIRESISGLSWENQMKKVLNSMNE